MIDHDRMKGGLAAVGILLAATGCASRLTPIGPGFIYEPDQREQRLWETSRALAAGLRVPGVVYEDDELREYLQGVLHRVVGNNLTPYLPLVFRVSIIDSTVPNASSYAQGDIFIHTGVLGRIRNEAQLASLIGHEVTHSTHRHVYQRSEDRYARRGTMTYLSVLSALGGGNIHKMVSGVGKVITEAAIAGFSRDNERESDQVGLILIAQAGYDPREGAKLWQQMLDATDRKDRNRHFMYASHPKMKERVKTSGRLVERMPSQLIEQATDVGRDRYVAAAGHLILEEARTHIVRGKFDLAEQTLLFLQEAMPDNAEPLSVLGDLCRARALSDDTERAVTAYEQALELDSDYASAHLGLGFTFVKSGQKLQALEHLRRFLELDPDAVNADYVREFITNLSTEP